MKPALGLLSAAIIATFATEASSDDGNLPQGGRQEAIYQRFEQAGAAPRVPLPSTRGVPSSAAQAGRQAVTPTIETPASPARTAAVTAVPEQGMSVTVERGDNASSRGSGAYAARDDAPKYLPGMTISGVAVVLDGHSMAVNGHAVRLHGLEAPGLGQTCTSASGTAWPCGEKARDRLERIAGGERITCFVTEQAGEGAAAFCSARGIADLGMLLASEGLVVPNGHARGKYAAAAGTAKAAGAGLWGGRFEAPWTWRLMNR